MTIRPAADDMRDTSADDDFRVVPASYVILRRGGEVLLQLRSGTGYMDGWWGCAAAGHVEAGESAPAAAARECEEELGIRVAATDLRPLTTVHRGCRIPLAVEQRMDLFFTLEEGHWSGEPRIQEPEKAADLRWFALTDLPDTVVPHERVVLDGLAAYHNPVETPVPAVLSVGFDQTMTLVAAIGTDRSIGDGDSMPWHLPEDLAHFKATTLGGVMIMGRGTWDSIGRALPGRRTIVVTRNRSWSAPGAEVAHSLPEALLIAGDREVFIVGGGQVYAETIDHADRLVLTHVHQRPGSSVRFPEVDPSRWVEVERDPREGFTFVTYTSRAPTVTPHESDRARSAPTAGPGGY